MSLRPIQFNLALSHAEKRSFQDAATDEGLTLSQYIRAALHARIAMDLDRRPTCATGAACRCPNAFPELIHSPHPQPRRQPDRAP